MFAYLNNTHQLQLNRVHERSSIFTNMHIETDMRAIVIIFRKLFILSALSYFSPIYPNTLLQKFILKFISVIKTMMSHALNAEKNISVTSKKKFFLFFFFFQQ